jgi:hypothetical protein
MNAGASQQLSLLMDEDEEPPDRRQGLQAIPWSHSRRSTLEQCLKRYYNEYFGANKRTAKRETAKEQLHFLKGLANRYERTGTILHLAIKSYFRKAQQGQPWNAADLVNWAQRIFRTDQKFSQSHPDGPIHSDERYPPVLLREYHYRQPGADALCLAAAERMANALSAFATDPRFEQFRRAGAMPNALIEHDLKLQNFPCKVGGKIDLAFEHAEGVTVVDWKLGEGDGMGNDSLQLAVYGLWASIHYGCAPDQLRICKVYLSSREIVDFAVTADVLAAARGRILQDAERMLVLQDYGERGIADAFTPCYQPNVCGMCPFERDCYA